MAAIGPAPIVSAGNMRVVILVECDPLHSCRKNRGLNSFSKGPKGAKLRSFYGSAVPTLILAFDFLSERCEIGNKQR